MDVRLILGLILGVIAVWVALLIVFWVFRPRGVSVREIAAVVPDLLRLLRSGGLQRVCVGDRMAPERRTD